MADKISVVIADDTQVTIEGLKILLGGIGDIDVIAAAKTPSEVVEITRRIQPNVVVLDLRWGGDEKMGAQLIGEIRTCSPNSTIIAMTAYSMLLPKAMNAGADAGIEKTFSRQELILTIRQSDYNARAKRVENRLVSLIRAKMNSEDDPRARILREKLADLRTTMTQLQALDQEYQFQDHPTYNETRRRFLQRIHAIEIDLEFDFPSETGV